MICLSLQNINNGNILYIIQKKKNLKKEKLVEEPFLRYTADLYESKTLHIFSTICDVDFSITLS